MHSVQCRSYIKFCQCQKTTTTNFYTQNYFKFCSVNDLSALFMYKIESNYFVFQNKTLINTVAVICHWMLRKRMYGLPAGKNIVYKNSCSVCAWRLATPLTQIKYLQQYQGPRWLCVSQYHQSLLVETLNLHQCLETKNHKTLVCGRTWLTQWSAWCN